MKKLIGTVADVICVLIISADVIVNIYVLVLGFHLRNMVSICNYVVVFYVILYLLGKYCFHKASSIEKDSKGYKGGGIICMFFAFILFIEASHYIFNLQIDARNYTSGNIIQDTVKVYDRTINSKPKGQNDAAPTIGSIYAKSVKTGKEIEFHDCPKLYMGDAEKGKIYKVKYLPTSHTLISIEEKQKK